MIGILTLLSTLDKLASLDSREKTMLILVPNQTQQA
jgi:hypothetical protein